MTTWPVNFITKVIARVDFQPILKLQQEVPIAYQEAIRENFPRLERKMSIEFPINPAGGVPIEFPINASGGVPFPMQSSVWQFTNKEKTDEIALTFKAIALSMNKYVSFETFFSKIELMYSNLYNIYHPGIIQKIGLRFTNEIKLTGNPLDWDGIINHNLYCILTAFPDLSSSVSRVMSQLHINLGDRLLTFQFGIYNREYPNTISQREFILDYNCSSKEEYEPEGVLSKFRIFYEDIKSLFKQCRGEKLIKLMSGEAI
jgi:uncharacterized protein (TIGR04255 family)